MKGLREEANLNQAGLARLIPADTKTGHRHLSWVSKIEKGEQEPSLADLGALARALKCSTDLLIYGNEAPNSEFVDQLRTMESLMDDRGKREVLATARRQVSETQRAIEANLRERLLAAARDVSPEHERMLRESIERLDQIEDDQAEPGVAGA